MDRTLNFAGTDLGTFGAHFTNGGDFPSPIREYERVEVLGRNGDIFIDNMKYKNVQNSYPAFIEENFRENYNDLVTFLSLNTGYQRLEDSLDPDVYRMAVFVGGIEPSVKSSDIMGNFNLVFNCKPQRFFKQDEEGVALNGTQHIPFSNPSPFVAKPLIKMYPNTEVVIEETSYEQFITRDVFDLNMGDWSGVYGSAYAFVDCETLEVYDENGRNLSSYLTISTYAYGNEKFPFLKGNSSFEAHMYNSGQQAATIWPRWWTI